MQVGDIGTSIVLTIIDQDGAVVNVSASSARNINFKKPNGAAMTKSASFFTDGTDGKIAYTTIAGDLDQAGIWDMQAKVVLPSGTWYSEVKKVTVGAQLPTS